MVISNRRTLLGEQIINLATIVDGRRYGASAQWTREYEPLLHLVYCETRLFD